MLICNEILSVHHYFPCTVRSTGIAFLKNEISLRMGSQCGNGKLIVVDTCYRRAVVRHPEVFVKQHCAMYLFKIHDDTVDSLHAMVPYSSGLSGFHWNGCILISNGLYWLCWGSECLQYQRHDYWVWLIRVMPSSIIISSQAISSWAKILNIRVVWSGLPNAVMSAFAQSSSTLANDENSCICVLKKKSRYQFMFEAHTAQMRLQFKAQTANHTVVAFTQRIHLRTWHSLEACQPWEWLQLCGFGIIPYGNNTSAPQWKKCKSFQSIPDFWPR